VQNADFENFFEKISLFSTKNSPFLPIYEEVFYIVKQNLPKIVTTTPLIAFAGTGKNLLDGGDLILEQDEGHNERHGFLASHQSSAQKIFKQSLEAALKMKVPSLICLKIRQLFTEFSLIQSSVTCGFWSCLKKVGDGISNN
jgi:hypothetical protein